MSDDFSRARAGLPLARDPKCACDHGPLDHDSHGCVACPCTVYHSNVDRDVDLERAALIALIEREGHWSERLWLPLLRLAHRRAGDA